MNKVYSEFDFNNTEIAFSWRTKRELKRANLLFSMFRYEGLMKFGMSTIKFMLKLGLPVSWLVKPLVFRHFCGGESIDGSMSTVKKLSEHEVYSIPDFSAEGSDTDEANERVKEEVLKAIKLATTEPYVLFAVFKPTGLASPELWEKLSLKEELDAEYSKKKESLERRLDEIFSYGSSLGVAVLVDAEEIRTQDAIDYYIRKYSEIYNKEKVLVYNTIQMYRNDRVDFVRREHELAVQNGYKIGYKIVRGAYHEQEYQKAIEAGRPSPVFTKKEDTDEAFNTVLKYCFEHRDVIAVNLATHNEESSETLAKLIANDPEPSKRLPYTFSQLYGMSDHITFNLAAAGYIVAKYLPYGPVKEVLPYLIRRAEENKSVTGETGRELYFIKIEKQRRSASK